MKRVMLWFPRCFHMRILFIKFPLFPEDVLLDIRSIFLSKTENFNQKCNSSTTSQFLLADMLSKKWYLGMLPQALQTTSRFQQLSLAIWSLDTACQTSLAHLRLREPKGEGQCLVEVLKRKNIQTRWARRLMLKSHES